MKNVDGSKMAERLNSSKRMNERKERMNRMKLVVVVVGNVDSVENEKSKQG